MALSVTHHDTGYGSNGVPGSVTVGFTPTAGRLLLAEIGTQNVADSAITIGSSWKYADMAQKEDDTNRTSTILYRYVVGGDTSTLPAFFSAGSSFWGWKVVEIDGVTGTWATDFLCAVHKYNSDTNATVAVPDCENANVNGCLAIAFFSHYDAASAPTISSGGYTALDNDVNFGAYGAMGSAYKALNAGDSAALTWGKATNNNPYGMSTIILTPTQPTTPFIRRTRQMVSGSNTPNHILMGGDPIDNDLLVVGFGWGNAGNAAPTIGGSWSEFDHSDSGGNPVIIGCRRYASSDTRSLPQLCTAGSAYWAATVVELSGVSGTFATDLKSDTVGNAGSGDITTGSVTTDKNNALAIIFAACYNGSSAMTMTGSFSLIAQNPNNGNYGNAALGWQRLPTSGTSFQSTISFGGGNTRSYIQALFEPGAVTETSTAVMTLTGVSMAAKGDDDTGAAAMALGGVSMNGAGSDTHAGGAIMALGGVNMNVLASDAHEGSGGMSLSKVNIVSAGQRVQHAPRVNIVVVNN